MNNNTSIIACPPKVRKTSSERSKAFRAKRKQREADARISVDTLRHEVEELQKRKCLYMERLIYQPQNNWSESSLMRIVREYYTLFQNGRAPLHSPLYTRQQEFLYCVMAPDVIVGSSRGIPDVLEQIRRYTESHSRFFNEIGETSVLGPCESPTVIVRSRIHVRINRETFHCMFPSALSNEALVQRFLDKDVVYDCISHFRFNEEGVIVLYLGEVDFLSGLLQVTGSFEDVVQLMTKALIGDDSKIGDSPMENIKEEVKSLSIDDHNQRSEIPSRQKLSVGFLLS